MYNEQEWIKLLFLLSDTQSWLDELSRACLLHLTASGNKKCFQKTYHLSVKTAAHIIERHYYKINRYPHTGKFHIPVAELFQLIREAHHLPVTPVTGTLNYSRIVQADKIIGFDKHNNPTSTFTILTDAGGNIITAFPISLSFSL